MQSALESRFDPAIFSACKVVQPLSCGEWAEKLWPGGQAIVSKPHKRSVKKAGCAYMMRVQASDHLSRLDVAGRECWSY